MALIIKVICVFVENLKNIEKYEEKIFISIILAFPFSLFSYVFIFGMLLRSYYMLCRYIFFLTSYHKYFSMLLCFFIAI